MNSQLIEVYQMNIIKKKIWQLLDTLRNSSDTEIIKISRENIQVQIENIIDKELINDVNLINNEADAQKFCRNLENYIIEFPRINEEFLSRAFGKKKYMKPNLANINYKSIVYYGWRDETNKKINLIINHDNKLKLFSLTYYFGSYFKKYQCSFCSRHGNGTEVVFVKYIFKKKSIDHYGSYMNLLCLDNETCNRNIVDITKIEKFIKTIIE